MEGPLISPKKLKEQLPLDAEKRAFIAYSRNLAKECLMGASQRLVVIVGPCSVHDVEGALEYARRLKRLSEEVEKNCMLVMRVYAEKPRTALGWKGFLYDPELDGTHDIGKGLYQTRRLLLELASMSVATATEFVDPLTAAYIDDLICWGFIGARTSESQPHRQLASCLPMPIGFKNATDGDLQGAINGVLASQHPQMFIHVNQEGKISSVASQGNPFTHLVLRGSATMPNYDPDSVQEAVDKLLKIRLSPRILVDCAHGNCQRQYQRQKDVFDSVIERISEGDPHLMGVMLESHLEAGNQSFSALSSNSISLTDPCIGWDMTEELIGSASSSLSESGMGPSGRSSTLSG